MFRHLIGTTTLATAAAVIASTAGAEEAVGDHFLVRDLDRGTEEAAAAVRDHAEADDDWLFLSEFGLLGGEVIAQKICYVPLAPDIVAAGMHVMAMMPCGHLAYYEEDGQPKLARLDLGFMTTLYPDENLERAVETGAPAFEAMLDEVLGTPVGG